MSKLTANIARSFNDLSDMLDAGWTITLNRPAFVGATMFTLVAEDDKGLAQSYHAATLADVIHMAMTDLDPHSH